MPPRCITGAIVVFWLATTTFLVYRETSLWYGTGEPPPFTIDLTDEVGANVTSWNVLVNGKQAGLGESKVTRLPDRTFEFYSHFSFNQNEIRILNLVSFKKLINKYRVTEDGKLVSLAAEVSFAGITKLDSKLDKVRVSGKVDKGYFTPDIRFELAGMKIDFPFAAFVGKVKVPERGVLDPMHLVGKINGLRVGQRWSIPLLNPLSFQNMTIPSLDAEVFADVLSWRGEPAICYRIDCREPGKKVTARIWVRRRDGFVLQQEAEHQGLHIILQRDKSHS